MEFIHFRVTNYRNIVDSGDIEVGKVTFVCKVKMKPARVTCLTLFAVSIPLTRAIQPISMKIGPVDDWGGKNASSKVCEAVFVLRSESVQGFMTLRILQPLSVAPAAVEETIAEGETSLPPLSNCA